MKGPLEGFTVWLWRANATATAAAAFLLPFDLPLFYYTALSSSALRLLYMSALPAPG